jgi:hypothetical protein
MFYPVFPSTAKYVLPNILLTPTLHPQVCFTQYSPPPPNMFYLIFPHPHTHFMFYSIIPTTPTLIYGCGGETWIKTQYVLLYMRVRVENIIWGI